ncbi:MAG: hypothetical protein QOF14_4384 [Hyphomicrobiales bacterium]|nr:hypothetical protein [Hyphomicrobiales bacterium]
MDNGMLPPASGERRRRVPGIVTHPFMEREAVILRARAGHAKIAALYAADEAERRDFEARASAYEAHARELKIHWTAGRAKPEPQHRIRVIYVSQQRRTLFRW